MLYLIVSNTTCCICTIGIIVNGLSLCKFTNGALKTSAMYLLQWLAAADTVFLVCLYSYENAWRVFFNPFIFVHIYLVWVHVTSFMMYRKSLEMYYACTPQAFGTRFSLHCVATWQFVSILEAHTEMLRTVDKILHANQLVNVIVDEVSQMTT